MLQNEMYGCLISEGSLSNISGLVYNKIPAQKINQPIFGTDCDDKFLLLKVLV
jgi:hypothetical protein